MSNKDWDLKLTPEQNYILRQEGTESPGSSSLNKEKFKNRETLDVILHYFFLNIKQVPLLQYLLPVGFGPSSNICP